jgi:hypothetical protein
MVRIPQNLIIDRIEQKLVFFKEYYANMLRDVY